jgi:PKD repeat protein
MAAPIAGFTGVPNYGEIPLTVQFTDLSTGIPTSWLWEFGDGTTGGTQNPSHLYTGLDSFGVVQTASNLDGPGVATGVVDTYVSASYVESPAVSLSPPLVKYCGALTCMGWVRTPVFGSAGDSIIPLAVSDTNGDVRGSDEAVYFELQWDATAGDHRLGFKGSQSLTVTSTTGVVLADGQWHMLCWICGTDGVATFYIDGIECPPRSGVGSDGILYSRPHSYATRSGSGYVWVPYLDKAGQAIGLYNWRYATDLYLHADWVREIMAVDAAALGV